MLVDKVTAKWKSRLLTNKKLLQKNMYVHTFLYYITWWIYNKFVSQKGLLKWTAY